MNWRRSIGIALLAAGLGLLFLKLSHTYDPTASIQRAQTKMSRPLARTIGRIQPAWLVYGGLIGLPICLGAILLAAGSRQGERTAVDAALTPVSVAAARRKSSRSPVHSCNVLRTGGDPEHLWQFDARNGGFVLAREQKAAVAEPLPAKLVAKDWRSLYQRNLNIAWLPPEHVFLRVAQFPQSTFEETVAMVELQLEKLSPMPVAQIVWSMHTLPQTVANMQTVIVIIVARNVVEEFLGRLEGRGFLADRIELPILDQLQAGGANEDGAWIYPDTQSGKSSALVAWWYGGVLQNLDLITLAPADRAGSAREQLMQMAWAGEMEGWLSGPPSFHLVTTGANAQEWEPALREGLEQDIHVAAPLPERELAGLTARRAAQSDLPVNLLPPEFTTRYKQEFHDRLWMRGLFAVFAVYVVGVIIYMIALQVALYRTRSVESQVIALGSSYTNAIQLEARLSVLRERQDLKYAALNCYRTVAELMPDSLTLETLNFSDGKRLTLNGTAPTDQRKDLIEFEGAMRKATINGDQLFEPSTGDTLSYHGNPGSPTVSWNFSLMLKRSEAQ